MAKFNETSQEASLCVPLQKYNKGSLLINNNNNNLANFLFCFLKKTSLKLPGQIHWNLQEASLHDSLAYTPRPLFVGWNMLIKTSMSMKYALCKDVFKLQHFY